MRDAWMDAYAEAFRNSVDDELTNEPEPPPTRMMEEAMRLEMERNRQRNEEAGERASQLGARTTQQQALARQAMSPQQHIGLLGAYTPSIQTYTWQGERDFQTGEPIENHFNVDKFRKKHPPSDKCLEKLEIKAFGKKL